MILEIFVVLIVLSLVLLLLGRYIDAPPLQISAYVILFLLGVTLMLGGVTFKSGESVSYGYVCSCCLNNSFSFNYYSNFSCFGTPADCDTYNGTEANCLLAGCSYDTGLNVCSGNPDECIVENEERDCEARLCEWGNNVSVSNCVNSSIVLNNESKTFVYSNYSGEIVQGVMLHHVFGLLISLLSALGFIIVFMNLKGGFRSL